MLGLTGIKQQNNKRGGSFAFIFSSSSSFCLISSVVFLLSCLSFEAEANTLVAYYYFDGNTMVPYSGICPFPPYLAAPAMTSGSPTWATGKTGFGTAFQYTGNSRYINAGGWSINSPTNGITLSAWVYSTGTSPQRDFSPIVKYGSRSLWQLRWLPSGNGFEFNVATGTGSSLTVSTNTNYGTNTWWHVVGVFNDGGQMKLYVNGAQVASQATNGQNIYEDSSPVYIASCTSSYWNALVDDVRVYDYALTSTQVTALYNLAGTQNPPTLTMSPNVIAPLGQPATIYGTPSGGSPPYTYTWSALGGCITATFSPPNTGTTNVTINGGVVYQTYTIQLGVTDSLLCATGTTAVTLDGYAPDYNRAASTYPTNGIFYVPRGGVATINLILTGEPTPNVQWQELVDLNPTRRELRYVHGVDEDEDTKEMRIAAVLSRCNSTANFTANCSTWLDIANQTSATYTSPIGDSTLDGTQIRFILSNVKGSFVSSPVTVSLSAGGSGSGSSGGDGGGTDIGVIIGPIVGAVAGLCCLLLLCLLVIIMLLLFRRKIVHSSSDFPGIPPDYEQVIFGPYLEPMFKVKSKHDSSLQKLESLLTSDRDYLFTAALARGAKKNFEESLARSYVYVFASHKQCEKVIETFVSMLLDDTVDPSTMFRANTVDSKMFKYFSLLVSAPYLWEVLAPFVWEIQKEAAAIDYEGDEEMGSSSSSMSMSMSTRKSSRRVVVGMEVDPTKMDEAADPKVNTLQLWLTAQKIFSSVTRSHRDMPKELADLLVFVHNAVGAKFSGEEYKAMGGFLFLRYICPSLLAPHLYGLLERPPSPTAQRQLILVGKVLQNLSNNTLPGTKEDYMQRLNEFITNNQSELLDFYNQILSASNLSTTNRSVPSQVKKNALADIYNILAASKDGVYQELGNYYGEGDPIFNQLEEILKHGPIPSEQ